jgi:hypothetical protein
LKPFVRSTRVPYEERYLEFSIDTLPADLDRFAELLRRFSALEHSVLEWTVTDGELLL